VLDDGASFFQAELALVIVPGVQGEARQPGSYQSRAVIYPFPNPYTCGTKFSRTVTSEDLIFGEAIVACTGGHDGSFASAATLNCRQGE
jgi:hypothetical protein